MSSKFESGDLGELSALITEHSKKKGFGFLETFSMLMILMSRQVYIQIEDKSDDGIKKFFLVALEINIKNIREEEK